MRVFKEILVSGQTEDPKQWVTVRPDFYNVRSDLTVLNEILMKGEHLHIPPSLRTRVLGVFHQSKTGMNIRAQNSISWQGITKDIESLRVQFGDCDINTPSLPAAPPTPLEQLRYPFQHVCAAYFQYCDHWYLVLVDMYSNWPSVFYPKNSGARCLIKILREYFATFG